MPTRIHSISFIAPLTSVIKNGKVNTSNETLFSGSEYRNTPQKYKNVNDNSNSLASVSCSHRVATEGASCSWANIYNCLFVLQLNVFYEAMAGEKVRK